ncbi:MAG TPA: thiamine-phosphate kinase [Nitrospiraceae bacterium]|nr:thiamine-phosphate kinase [Nitrospiraceae bacterium]
MREFSLIAELHRRYGKGHSSIIRGIGDDTAVVRAASGSWSLLTTDLLVEGIHFDRHTASFSEIGYRAAVANLSDIAAMGGTPQYLLIALAVPSGGTRAQVHQLYRGMMAACRPHGVRLIGGDTSASKSGWFLSLALIGTVAPRRALLRKGAQAGDLLYVTGTLGDASIGLTLLNEAASRRYRRGKRGTLSRTHKQFLIQRHLHPTARVKEGRWLSAGRLATAAIDLSDGLSGDLHHLCDESRVGVEVNLAAIPLSPACRAYAQGRRLNPTAVALAGGEDYELLFTVAPRHQARLEREAKRLGFRITNIGTIRPARLGMHARSSKRGSRPLPVTSYEHFI